MIVAGDVHLSDLNDEERRRVLVVSNRRFHDASRRALVAPELFGEPDAVAFPWRVEVNGVVFALDLLRSLPIERLLDRVDRASASAMAAVERTLTNITR